jgi:hypothetical protein
MPHHHNQPLRSRRPPLGDSFWIDSSNAPDPSDLSVLPRVRVTHPFHPWAGRELEFVKRRHNWRADRVYVRDDADGLVSLPAEWTDAVPEDPFVVVASGRAPFHLEGLLALAELVASLVAGRSSARNRAAPSDELAVKRITPLMSGRFCRA